MKRFWLGGAAVAACVAAAFAVLAFVVPPTYEVTSVIEVSGEGAIDSQALAQELRKAILDSGRIEDLARHSDPADDPLSALDRVRRSFRIAPRSERAFSISFEGRNPESTLHGGEVLLDAALEHFAHDAARHDEKQARADLEKRTRALADFVTLHPDFSPGPSTPAGTPIAQAQGSPKSVRDDPTLSVLRQERVRLEGKLAAAQAETARPGDKNPYDDEADSDIVALGRQLAQVRLAIAAHQKAITDRAQSPPAQNPEAAAEAARRASLDSEWRSLVRAVVEAQSTPPAEPGSRPSRTARVVEQPTLPTRPVKPNRPLVSIVGVLLGVGAGAVWAFTRVNLSDRIRRQHAAARERAASGATPPLGTAVGGHPALTARAAPPVEASGSSPPPQAAPAVQVSGSSEFAQAAAAESPAAEKPEPFAFAKTVALPAAAEAPPSPAAERALAPTELQPMAAPLAVAEPDQGARNPSAGTAAARDAETVGSRARPLPAESRSISPPADVRLRPGLRDLGTQRGMIDPAFVRARTGETPKSLEQQLETRPIVDVSRDRRSEPPPERGERPTSPPRSVTPPGPTSAPITQRLGSPSDPADAQHRPSQPPPDKPDTSYSFVDRGWRATARRSSHPPSRPPERPGHGEAPNPGPAIAPRASSNRPESTKPGWTRPSPPAVAAVSEVWARVSAPTETPAEEIVEPRSVPPTWSAPPAEPPQGPSGELSALSEKIVELARSTCVVIGVIAERPELEAKSRIAARLASMVSEGSPRVLLMEANFDWPLVHRQMSISMPHFSGFSQQMHARTRKGEKRPWIVVRCSPALDVLAEGIVRSPGVLYSQQFSEAVSELRRYYRVIICDGPVAGGADARPLDAVTDGIVVVGPSQSALLASLERVGRWFGKKQLLAAVPAGTLPGK